MRRIRSRNRTSDLFLVFADVKQPVASCREDEDNLPVPGCCTPARRPCSIRRLVAGEGNHAALQAVPLVHSWRRRRRRGLNTRSQPEDQRHASHLTAEESRDDRDDDVNPAVHDYLLVVRQHAA